MRRILSKKAVKWVGIAAIALGAAFSCGYLLGADSARIKNRYLALEQDVRATKKHEIFLEKILDDMDKEYTRKLAVKGEANALFDAFGHAMDKNNFIYEPTNLLSEALEDRRLKPEIVKCIQDNKYLIVDPDSLDCSEISKRFIKKKYDLKIDLDSAVRKSDCDTNSLIIKAFADRRGIKDVRIVNAPNHAFIRYIPKNGGHINFETTSREVLSDEHYISHHRISAESIANRVYMIGLDENGVISLIHFNKAVYSSENNMQGKAEEEYLLAIQYDPTNTAAMHNLSLMMYEADDLDKAEKFNRLTLNLDPEYAIAHSVKGDILEALGKDSLAKEEQDIAKRLGYIPKEKNHESFFE